MALKDLIGHDSQIQVLQQSLQKETLAHAYLFYGPAGVGKDRIATELVKTLNCEKGGKESCDACPVCLRIEKGTFSDHFKISPTGASRIIKIDDILGLQKKLNLSRFEGRAKTIVLSDADRLNEASSNALLKILEEPMPKTYFILVSSNHEAILATIRSRCRQIAFYPLSTEEVCQVLEKKGFEDQNSREQLARISEGSLSRALRLHEEEGRALRQSLIKFALTSEHTTTNSLFVSEQMAKRAEADKTYLWDILEILEGIYRDMAALKLGGKDSILLNPDWSQGIRQTLGKVSIADLDKRIETIERIRADLHRNTPLKFALDYLFLYLSGQHQDVKVITKR